VRRLFGTAANALERLALSDAVTQAEMNRVLRYEDIGEDLQFQIEMAWHRWCAEHLKTDVEHGNFTITKWNT
jgi:hypothetical protein